MVNLRYHIVSIVAVFLALALGVLMGATVIDQGIVNQQKTNLATLEGRLEDRRTQIRDLERAAEETNKFLDEVEVPIVARRLSDVGIFVLGIDGVNRNDVEAMRAELAAAGAADLGALWFTDKWGGSASGVAKDLGDAVPAWVQGLPGTGEADKAIHAVVSELVGTTTTTAALQSSVSVTSSTASALSTSAAGGTAPVATAPTLLDGISESAPTRGEAVIDALDGAGFVEVDKGRVARDAPECTLPGWCAKEAVATQRTVLVVVSGDGAKVPDDQLAVPLVDSVVELAAQRGDVISLPLLVESAPDDATEVPALFVGQVRSARLGDRVSTIDDVGTVEGRLVAVLAVDELVRGRRGHYGTGPGADRRVPGAG